MIFLMILILIMPIVTVGIVLYQQEKDFSDFQKGCGKIEMEIEKSQKQLDILNTIDKSNQKGK